MLLVKCKKEEGNPFDSRVYTSFDFEINKISGFDDYLRNATLGIAIDDSKIAALIIAMKYNGTVLHKKYNVSVNSEEMIKDYQWGNLNSITAATATNYPFLTKALTDTEGIRTMDEEIFAIFIIKGQSDNPDKYFIAVNGTINLTREDSGNIIEGDLKFVEINEASNEALIVNNGESIEINNIYFYFDTNTQPK